MRHRHPAGFGVGFAYYAQHMKRNHLDREVDAILKDKRFATDPPWRKPGSSTP